MPDYTSEVDGYNVTNTHEIEQVSVEGNKTWNDNDNQDGKRPEKITIILLENGKKIASKVVTESDNWSWKFENLDKFKDSKEVAYTIKESEVPGYTSEVDGYNVINNHAIEQVKVEGSKTWNDKDNQDGKRPESIRINLLANGKEIASKEVTAADNWNWQFEGLDKYEVGKEIVYSIVENQVEGYSTIINGYDITNSYTPGKTSVQVTKAWEDNNNQDGKRPGLVEVQLLKNGEEVPGKILTLLGKNNWSGSFIDLDEYEAGEKIEYTVKEIGVNKGYTSMVNGSQEAGYIITNTLDQEKTEIIGNKIWQDEDNQDGKRPEAITVNLLADGKWITSKKVTADDNWSWKFENLDKFADGEEIIYSVVEDRVEDYSTTITGNNIINSYTPGKTSIQVTKAWEDNHNQDGKRAGIVQVQLMKNGEEVENQILTLLEKNNWTGSFTNLDEYEAGEKINYTVKEICVKDGYTSKVSGNMETGYLITNTKNPETTEVVGYKTWDDKNNQDGKRPESLRINLLANGRQIASKVVTAADNWNWKFENLDKFADGEEIIYSVVEDRVEDYSTTITGNNIINSYTPGKTSIQVTKAWEDNHNQDGKRAGIVQVQLMKNGEEVENQVLTLLEKNNWTGSFTDLDEYQDGKKIDYTVKEIAVENGYTSFVTGDANQGYIITNTKKPEKTVVEGTKTWDDNDNQDGKRPESITINLLANGKWITSKKVTAEDGWSWKFENLDKFAAGEEIIYSVVEGKVEGYSTSINGNNIINSYTPGKTSVQVTKAWEDNHNQDGKRAGIVQVQLVKNGEEVEDQILTLLEKNHWTGSFTDLDEYEDGRKIDYTVKEMNTNKGYKKSVIGTAEKGYIITNSREPEKTVVEGTKTWDDNNNQDGKRPESITINLLANGKWITSKKVTAEDGWSWKFENLDKFAAGEEIIYSVVEGKVEGYSTSINGNNIINSYTPGKTSVQVTKAWEDQNNQDGVRPTSVKIQLLANGKATGKTVTLTKDNNWSNSFASLAEYEAGEKINYTVEEKAVKNGYTSVVTGDSTKGYIITNTRKPEKTVVEGTKTWDDNDNQDGKRPEAITINLLKNGTKISSKIVTEKDGWKWKFEGLDKYEAGKKLIYTISEETIKDYTCKIKGYNVLNSYTPGKTSIQVTKAWEDKNDLEGKRPDKVKIQLLVNGREEKGKIITLTKDRNWSGTFTDLDEYKAGKRILYAVKEVGESGASIKINSTDYQVNYYGNVQEGFVIYNTQKTFTPEDSNKTNKSIPKTGDGLNTGLYLGIMILAGGTFVLLLNKRKKTSKTKNNN